MHRWGHGSPRDQNLSVQRFARTVGGVLGQAKNLRAFGVLGLSHPRLRRQDDVRITPRPYRWKNFLHAGRERAPMRTWRTASVSVSATASRISGHCPRLPHRKLARPHCRRELMRARTPLIRDRNCTNDRHSPQRLVCSKGPYDVTEYFSRRPARNRPASLRSRNRRSDMICALFGQRARSPVDTRPCPFQGGQPRVACHDPHGACRAGGMHWGDGGGDNAGQPARARADDHRVQSGCHGNARRRETPGGRPWGGAPARRGPALVVHGELARALVHPVSDRWRPNARTSAASPEPGLAVSLSLRSASPGGA
jgi:hypothetical protein